MWTNVYRRAPATGEVILSTAELAKRTAAGGANVLALTEAMKRADGYQGFRDLRRRGRPADNLDPPPLK
jgi:hypothetical protein